MSRFISIFNSMHTNPRMNRVSLGLLMSRSSKQFSVIRWRVADVVLIVLLVTIFFSMRNVKPFQRQFVISDPTISHPFTKLERVSTSRLFVLSTILPLAVILVAGIFINPPGHKVYNTYVAVTGLLISVLATSTATDILKNFIGRCRPDFIARCVPSADAPRDIMVFAADVCTTTNSSRLMDGFRTTPSGHSSLSFAGLLYLLLWIAGQLVVTHELVGAWRSVLSSLPCFLAAYIAISRTQDYRHHFVDIFIGSCIGCLIGAWSYLRVFPPLSSPHAHVPRITQTLLLEKNDQSTMPYDSVENRV